jgi:hypothetical protein
MGALKGTSDKVIGTAKDAAARPRPQSGGKDFITDVMHVHECHFSPDRRSQFLDVFVKFVA